MVYFAYHKLGATATKDSYLLARMIDSKEGLVDRTT